MAFSDILRVDYPSSKLCGILPLKLLVRGIPETPPPKKKIPTIAIALNCPPELDGKTLSLQTPQTLVTGHADTTLVGQEASFLPVGWY